MVLHPASMTRVGTLMVDRSSRLEKSRYSLVITDSLLFPKGLFEQAWKIRERKIRSQGDVFMGSI